MPVKCPMPDSWCPLPDTSEMGKCPQCPVPAMPLPAMPAARYFCPPHITTLIQSVLKSKNAIAALVNYNKCLVSSITSGFVSSTLHDK